MNKLNLLSKLAIAGTLGMIGTVGVTATSADASTGGVAWTVFTNDFIDQLNPDLDVPPLDDPPDTFNLIFGDGGAATSINSTSGKFINWLGDAPPSFSINVPEVTVELQQSIPLDGTPPALAVYTAVNDETFDFSSGLLPTASITSLEWVVPMGTQFLLTGLTENSANVSLCVETCEGRPFWLADGEELHAINNIAVEVDPQQAQSSASSTLIKKAPEPGTVLGLLAISGLGFGLKRKKQS